MKNPEIRFIDDNIDWVSTNFKNIYIKASEGGTPSTTVDAFYKNGTIPFVKIEDTEQKYIETVNNFITELGLKNSSAWIVPENSLIFTNGATVGNVAINKIPISTKQGILSIIQKQNFDIEFLYYILSSKKFQKEVDMRKTKGTFETIILKYLDEIKIKFPNITIQKEVSSLLSDIDKKISNQEILIQKLKDTKSSLLVKIFPQEKQSIPELRFSGFTNDWEQRKLGDCFDERTERSANGELIAVTINSGVLRASELNRHDTSSKDKSNYKVVKINDIAYNSMRMWQGASGFSKYNGILSPAYTVVIPKENIDSIFFAYLFKKTDIIEKFKLNSQGLTSDTWNLKFPKFSIITIKVPKIEEQQKISSLFTNLDNLITLHQRKLDKLKEVKSALLDKLLV